MEAEAGAAAEPSAASGLSAWRDAQLAGESFISAVNSVPDDGQPAAVAGAQPLPPPPPAAAAAAAEAGSPLRASPEASASSEVAPPGPKPSVSSKLRRIQQRSDQLRQLFGVPATEGLVEDFACALKKKMLLQGRMFVFEEHVCFYTNLFGYVKIKVIPLSDVLDVRKKKNVGFPNSIEVTWGPNGKREFFTSFLHRGEAYRAIMSQWRRCSDLAPPSPEPGGEEPGSVQDSGLSGRTKRLLRGVSGLVQRASGHHASEDSGMGRSSAESAGSLSFLGGLPPAGPLESLAEEAVLPQGAAAAAASAGLAGSSTEEGGGLDGEPSFSAPCWAGDSSFVVAPRSPGGEAGSAGTSAHSSPSRPGTALSDAPVAPLEGGLESTHYTLEFQALTDHQCQRELEAEMDGGGEPAPPPDPDMQPVLEFELACSPLQFWCRFLANASDFVVRFHESRGDSAIRLGRWTRHFKVGMVRDLQFVTPVKAKIGPPQAVCHQTQRLQAFSGRHLVLETSQVMSDIPYADHFSVETRWDIVPRGDGGCRVTMRAKVPFSKATMWKKFIEKGSMEQLLESIQAYSRMAAARLAAEPASARSAPYAHHARRHSRVGSVSGPLPGGVPVGRQQAVLARHRRKASQVTDAMAAAAIEAAPSPRTLEEQKRQLAALRAGPPRPAAVRLVAAALAPVLAVLAWLAGLVAAAARAAWAHPGQLAVGCLGCVIIGMQAALLLEQRRQLGAVQQHYGTPPSAAPAAAAAAGAGAAGPEAAAQAAAQVAAQAAAALGREVANLQHTLQQLHLQGEAWQGQLQSALASAAELAQRLHQQQPAGGRGA